MQEGKDPLTHGIHMSERRLIKHRRTTNCFKNIDMRLRQRYVSIKIRCTYMKFSLMVEEGEETIDGLEVFNYLGRIMEHSDDGCTEVRWDIWKERQIWGHLGKILSREGADTIILSTFYHAVVQTVLIFGEEHSSSCTRWRRGSIGYIQGSCNM